MIISVKIKITEQTGIHKIAYFFHIGLTNHQKKKTIAHSIFSAQILHTFLSFVQFHVYWVYVCMYGGPRAHWRVCVLISLTLILVIAIEECKYKKKMQRERERERHFLSIT